MGATCRRCLSHPPVRRVEAEFPKCLLPYGWRSSAWGTRVGDISGIGGRQPLSLAGPSSCTAID